MIIQPLWTIVNNFLNNELIVCVHHIKENLQEWEGMLEEEEKKIGKRKISNQIKIKKDSFC